MRLKVSGTKGQYIDSRQTGLFTRGHKHYNRFLGRMATNGIVDGLHHGQETRRGVACVEALRGRDRRVLQ